MWLVYPLFAPATRTRGETLSPALDAALLHGSSIGGARPKALLNDPSRTVIAKLSSTTDTYPVVKAEFVAMRLAQLAGLDAALVQLERVSGRDVLLVDRFDRPGDGTRRGFVSALTILGLDEMIGRYASYHELAVKVRERFSEPAATLRELFSRITFNILIGNTDDHARNHAACYDPDTEPQRVQHPSQRPAVRRHLRVARRNSWRLSLDRRNGYCGRRAASPNHPAEPQVLGPHGLSPWGTPPA